MKIGILTFHRAINYGAFLQSYGLSKRLKCDFPNVEFEIIDYIAPKEQSKVYKNMLKALKHYGVQGFIKEIVKVKVFNSSLRYLPISKNRMFPHDLGELYQFINSNYDMLIIGSDAVFNWNQTGFPTAFIPEYDFSIPVVTYAASVHGLRFFDADKRIIELCGKAFRKMSFIGVRDQTTEEFVKFCASDMQPVHCCDPTFLVDITELRNLYDVDNIFKRYNISAQTPYIILMTQNDRVSKEIYDHYRNKYLIISLFKPNRYSKVFMYDLNPFEWVAVLAYSKMIVTSYFHGTLFGLVQDKPVIVVDESRYNDPYEGKLRDLMNRRLLLGELYFQAEELSSTECHEKFLSVVEEALSGNFDKRIKVSVMNERKQYDTFAEFMRENIQ